MPCSFTHPPGLTVTKVFWTIKPEPHEEPSDLSNNTEFKGRVLYSAIIKNNCTLTLREVKQSDAGEYHPRILTDDPREKWLGKPGLCLSVTGKVL